MAAKSARASKKRPDPHTLFLAKLERWALLLIEVKKLEQMLADARRDGVVGEWSGKNGQIALDTVFSYVVGAVPTE